MRIKILFVGVMLLSAMLGHATELSEPFAIAPDVKETRSQKWASATWAESAQCWLVVWREGYINETLSDIWCARISADGKAMDPAGIRITTGKEVKDRPRVATDGKDFMVIWEDFRNGKDWDVYASRVSGTTSLLDPEPILVAGGAHNQCRPDIAFSQGNYSVLWMAFVDGYYEIFGTRISPEGKLLADAPAGVYVFDRTLKKIKKKESQAILPVLAGNSKGELLSTCFITTQFRRRYISRQAIDPATGGAKGARAPKPKGFGDKDSPGMFGFFRDRAPALAFGPDNAMTVFSSAASHKSKNDIAVFFYSKTGDVLHHQELGSTLTIKDHFKPILPRPAATFDGKSYLAIAECLIKGKKIRDVMRFRARIVGWRLSPDGTVEDKNGFLIAGDASADCILPFVSAGPEGTAVVLYSKVSGVDDVKLFARVIK